jgi:hypothetical protein
MLNSKVPSLHGSRPRHSSEGTIQKEILADRKV